MLATTLLVGPLLGVTACTAEPEPTPSGTDDPDQPPSSSAPATSGAATLRLEVAPEAPEGSAIAAEDLVRAEGAAAAVSVVSALDGVVEAAVGPGGVPALRFPAYDDREVAPGVVVTVSAPGEAALDPGGGDFRFGVDLALDRVTSGSTVRDNGDNVLQRGLYDQGAQFKLQVDRHVPSCSFEGSAGRVDVVAEAELAPEQWYRLQCERRGDDFALVVQTLDDTGAVGAEQQYAVTAAVGELAFDPATPLTIGGKIAPDGGVATASDQFNGVLTGVFVELG